jgi:hypothetical protein
MFFLDMFFFEHIFLNIFSFKNILQIFFFKTVKLNMIVSYLPFFLAKTFALLGMMPYKSCHNIGVLAGLG